MIVGDALFLFSTKTTIKNVTILLTVKKVIILSLVIVQVLMQSLFFLADGEFDCGSFKFFFLYICPCMLVLALISYLIYALIMGGEYCVVFEMTSEGISHTQVAKQFKKTKILAIIATMAGAASGSASLAGTGILAGSKNSLYTPFKKVYLIKVVRKRDVIYSSFS